MGTRADAGRVGPRDIEWPTVILIVACYAAWLAIGLVDLPLAPWLALAGLALVVAMQSSLMHEAAHGHPTRNAALNEFLVALPIGLVYPYRRFKALHLRHHADERLTDPLDDPESFYRALWQHQSLPAPLKVLLRANNTLAGRFLIGPALADAAFLAGEYRRLREGDPRVRRAWLHHLAGLAVVVAVVAYLFAIPVWAYLVAAYLGQSLIAIRTFAEHQWTERPDGRTIIIERSPLAFLFLNNNLHLVHHKLPTAPWYRLPALYRARREEWLSMNGNYAYPGYFALFRDFAFRPKEPVVHPALRRAPEPGRAFRPRMRSRNFSGLGTAAVPAKPPKD